MVLILFDFVSNTIQCINISLKEQFTRKFRTQKKIFLRRLYDLHWFYWFYVVHGYRRGNQQLAIVKSLRGLVKIFIDNMGVTSTFSLI